MDPNAKIDGTPFGVLMQQAALGVSFWRRRDGARRRTPVRASRGAEGNAVRTSRGERRVPVTRDAESPQAVKLKTHVHKVDRVRFDRWPKFYQNTAFIKDEQRAERELPYAERARPRRAPECASTPLLRHGRGAEVQGHCGRGLQGRRL